MSKVRILVLSFLVSKVGTASKIKITEGNWTIEVRIDPLHFGLEDTRFPTNLDYAVVSNIGFG